MRWLNALVGKLGPQPTKEQLTEYVQDTLARGNVVPGYGHGVLRKTDPRYTCQVRGEREAGRGGGTHRVLIGCWPGANCCRATATVCCARRTPATSGRGRGGGKGGGTYRVLIGCWPGANWCRATAKVCCACQVRGERGGGRRGGSEERSSGDETWEVAGKMLRRISCPASHFVLVFCFCLVPHCSVSLPRSSCPTTPCSKWSATCTRLCLRCWARLARCVGGRGGKGEESRSVREGRFARESMGWRQAGRVWALLFNRQKSCASSLTLSQQRCSACPPAG